MARAKSTTIGRMAKGEVGYISPAVISVSGKQAFLNLNVVVERTAGPYDVRVEMVKGGCKIEFRGFDRHHWRTLEPKPGAVKVVKIRAGRRTYREWSDKLLYVSVGRMRVGKRRVYYIKQDDIRTVEGTDSKTFRGAMVYKKGGPDMVLIRRVDPHRYEVQSGIGRWMGLIVED